MVGELGSSDMFVFKGKSYLVCIDKVSGLVLCDTLHNQKAETVTKQLESWIAILGLPSVLKTDRGPCYTAELFEQFGKKLGILHVVTSAFNSEFNRQSECAVQEYVCLERSQGN